MLSERTVVVEGEGGGGIKAKLAARFKRRSEDSPEKKKQLQDYTAWVNNYLRRKPGTALISDLRTNLSDGVTFVTLVEIVAKAQVAGVERYPATGVGRKANTERVLEFLQGDGVNLHSDACRDLMDGNVKGVMKVILAVAERYQPKSVKPRTTTALADQNKPTNQMPPPPAWGDRRGVTPPYNPDLRPSLPPSSSSPSSPFLPPSLGMAMPLGHSLSQPALGHHGNGHHGNLASFLHLSQPERLPYEREVGGRDLSSYHGDNDTYSTPVDQLPPTAPPQVICARRKPGGGGRLRSGSGGMRGIPEEGAEEGVVGPGVQGGELTNEIGAVVSGLTEFKSELLQLHAVLLRNSDGMGSNKGQGGRGGGERVKSEDGEGEGGGGGGGGGEADRRQEREELSILREQVVQMQDEYTQVEAECAALRNMVEERNAFITTMKSEIYRKEYLNDTERMELHQQLLQKDSYLSKLECDLAGCHGALEERQTVVQELQGQLREREQEEERVRGELASLRAELGKCVSLEEALQSKLSGRERKISHLEERLADSQEGRARHGDQLSVQIEAIRESLSQLSAESAQLGTESAVHGAVECVEQAVAEMAAILAEKPASPLGRRRRQRDGEEHSREARHRRRHKERHAPSQPETHTQTTPTAESTKVMYYMDSDKTETPYVTIVPKKPTEVTLKDFKLVFNRHGNFKFFFKTEDPDCGVVKEEVREEEAPLPRWGGKVVAWVRDTVKQ